MSQGSAQYLYGFVLATDGGIALSDTRGVGEGIPQIVGAEKVAAVVSPAPHLDFTALAPEALLLCLGCHQRVLGRVMQEVPVLPAKFGTWLDAAEEVHQVLDVAQRDQVDAALEALRGWWEVDMAVTWDVPYLLQELATQHTLLPVAGLGRRGRGGGVEFQVHLLEELMNRQREEYRQRILRGLGNFRVREKPLVSERMVFNGAVLVHADSERLLGSFAERLNAELGEELTFRLVGPLPPYSFAWAEVQRISGEELGQALKTLGVISVAGQRELIAAFRRQVVRLCQGCDTGAAPLQEEMARLQAAREVVQAALRYLPGGVSVSDIFCGPLHEVTLNYPPEVLSGSVASPGPP